LSHKNAYNKIPVTFFLFILTEGCKQCKIFYKEAEMKKISLTAGMFGLIISLFFSSEGQTEYKGKLNCKNINSFLMDYNLSDGRIRGLCVGAISACVAEEALGKLPAASPLHAEISTKLKDNLDLQLDLCEVGFAAFAPLMYKDNLAR